MADPVLEALNRARAICFGSGVSTRDGAVRGELDRGFVADALNEVWDAYILATNTRMNEALTLLRDLTKHETRPCSFDHHGYCQEHGWFDSEAEGGRACPIPRARRLLGTDAE